MKGYLHVLHGPPHHSTMAISPASLVVIMEQDFVQYAHSLGHSGLYNTTVTKETTRQENHALLPLSKGQVTKKKFNSNRMHEKSC